MLPVAAIIIIPYIKHYHAKVALLMVNGLILGVLEAAVHVVSIAIVAKLVRSEMQGIAEALRMAILYLARALSGFIVSTIYEHILIGGAIVITLNLCCAIALAFEIDYFTRNNQ